MGLVNHDMDGLLRNELVHHVEDLAQRGVVAFHAIQRLERHEEHAMPAGDVRVRLQHMLDPLSEGLHRVVLEGVQRTCRFEGRRGYAIADGVVNVFVEHDGIAPLRDGGPEREVGVVPGVEEYCRGCVEPWASEEVRHLRLEVGVAVLVSSQEARASGTENEGHPGNVLQECVAGVEVGAEGKVVVREKVRSGSRHRLAEVIAPDTQASSLVHDSLDYSVQGSTHDAVWYECDAEAVERARGVGRGCTLADLLTRR